MSFPINASRSTSRFPIALMALLVLTAIGCPAESSQSDGGDGVTTDAGPQSANLDAGNANLPLPGAGDECDDTFVPRCNEDNLAQLLKCNTDTGRVATQLCSLTFTVCGTTDCVAQPCPDRCVAAQVGDRCSVRNAGDRGTHCQGSLGCVFGMTSSDPLEFDEVCADTAACAQGDRTAGCVGEIATWCVSSLTPSLVAPAAGVDCASFGGTCALDATLGTVCEGAEGAFCNDLDPTSVFRCIDGLVCEGASATSAGACAQP